MQLVELLLGFISVVRFNLAVFLKLIQNTVSFMVFHITQCCTTWTCSSGTSAAVHIKIQIIN
jgi:hypothetical protein